MSDLSIRHRPPFYVVIDEARCAHCQRCVRECGWEVLSFQNGMIQADHQRCVACQRCVCTCPRQAIHIEEDRNAYRAHPLWSSNIRRQLEQQAATGGISLVAGGNDLAFPIWWDHLVLDACQVTNPPIDPLREPIELRTYLGPRPERLSLFDGEPTSAVIPLRLETPLMFAPMSFGAISLPAQKAMAMAAQNLGILMNVGEGGLHPDLYPYADHLIVQVASGRFGLDPEILQKAAAVEIKIGQGAKPGIGGHLPGEKVGPEVARTRMVPVGSDCISPAPHHDIYSIEDLAQLIEVIKEVTDHRKLVGVKVAAVHNIAAIASGVVRAGADYLFLDGFRGGTGAAPRIIRDHVGLPIEAALAVVDDRLRREGLRQKVSLVVAGGIRQSADVAKAIALGADVVAIGTAALMALGCHLCQSCYTGNCSWGIATQKPELVSRLDPEWGRRRLENLVRAWNQELKEVLGALGINAIESLRGNRERLRAMGLEAAALEVLGVQEVGA